METEVGEMQRPRRCAIDAVRLGLHGDPGARGMRVWSPHVEGPGCWVDKPFSRGVEQIQGTTEKVEIILSLVEVGTLASHVPVLVVTWIVSKTLWGVREHSPRPCEEAKSDIQRCDGASKIGGFRQRRVDDDASTKVGTVTSLAP